MTKKILFCALCVILTACTTTKYVTVPEYHTDTLIQTSVQRDSIYMHDSVWVNQYQKGDTIFVESGKWLTKYIERIKTDTIYQSRTDSVGVPYPVEVQVPRQLTWWQRTRMYAGNVLLVLLSGIVIYGAILRFRK